MPVLRVLVPHRLVRLAHHELNAHKGTVRLAVPWNGNDHLLQRHALVAASKASLGEAEWGLHCNVIHRFCVEREDLLIGKEPLPWLVPRHPPVQHNIVQHVGGDDYVSLHHTSAAAALGRWVVLHVVLHLEQHLPVPKEGRNPLGHRLGGVAGGLARPPVQHRHGHLPRGGGRPRAPTLEDIAQLARASLANAAICEFGLL
mmetsp:Transcript_21996/g.41984  ORF Transcript_21996/g.41984 Transcript_21996/m.41984 type:complete len:201 (+) Transcript_21996:3194-3796(+)